MGINPAFLGIPSRRKGLPEGDICRRLLDFKVDAWEGDIGFRDRNKCWCLGEEEMCLRYLLAMEDFGRIMSDL